MDLTRILGIGIGRGGNVLLNELLKKDARISGLFVNSAYGDTEDLEKFDTNKNAYIFAGTNGTGRDRDNAKEFLKDQIQGLADRVSRYPNQDVIYVFFSLDGGTGSGTAPIFLNVLRRTCPDKKINVVGIIPDFNNADKLSLENTINCWKDIDKIIFDEDGDYRNVVDSVMYVDNSKRKTFIEVNEKAISDLYNSLQMNGKCDIGSIDDGDAKRTLTAKGFSFILTLDDDFNNVKDAINDAIKHSVFAKPNQYICDYVAISVKDYNIEKVRDQFEYNETAYVASNDRHNVIAMGGCDEPSEVIETVKMAYDDLLKKINSRERGKRAKVDLEVNTNSKVKNDKKLSKSPTKMSGKELQDLFSDLF